jgi:hypothetical protein
MNWAWRKPVLVSTSRDVLCAVNVSGPAVKWWESQLLVLKAGGHTRKVATPFDESPPDCIACGSCSYICPVQVIPMEDKNGVRTIWKADFPMQKCAECGRYFAPVKQLEYFRKLVNLPEDHFNKCKNCR